MLRRYRRRANTAVTAVRLDLDTDGFGYRKWGSTQRCKPGDWLVDNDGDVYTVDACTFARTYRRVAPGRYVKDTCVWARCATAAGVIETKEGCTHYEAGDFLVYNHEDATDGYAMTAQIFASLYEADERS